MNIQGIVIVVTSLLTLAGAGVIFWFTGRGLANRIWLMFAAILAESVGLTIITIFLGSNVIETGVSVLLAASEILLAFVVTMVVIAKRTDPRHRWTHAGIFIAGTLVVLLGDTLVGKVVFYCLCSHDGGVRIYKAVDRNKGILVTRPGNYIPGCDSACMLMLGRDRYAFVEMTATRAISPDPNFFTDTSGKRRFYLGKRGAEECQLYDSYLKKHPHLETIYDKEYGIKKEDCIASISTNEFRSPYVYDSTFGPYIKPLFIYRSTQDISDLSSGEKFAEQVYYKHGNGWIRLGDDANYCPDLSSRDLYSIALEHLPAAR